MVYHTSLQRACIHTMSQRPGRTPVCVHNYIQKVKLASYGHIQACRNNWLEWSIGSTCGERNLSFSTLGVSVIRGVSEQRAILDDLVRGVLIVFLFNITFSAEAEAREECCCFTGDTDQRFVVVHQRYEMHDYTFRIQVSSPGWLMT